MCYGSKSGCVLCVCCFGWMVVLGFERQQSELGSGGDIEAH